MAFVAVAEDRVLVVSGAAGGAGGASTTKGGDGGDVAAGRGALVIDTTSLVAAVGWDGAGS